MAHEHLEAWGTDDLIAELDRRLREQGFDAEHGGVQTIVDYLREGWSVIAVPPEVAERVVGTPVTPATLHSLAAELRHMVEQKAAAGG